MRPLAMLSLFFGLSATAKADFPEPSKLPARPDMPDPLVMLDGTKVSTKEQWETKRKPELKALFQHYMYGTIPGWTATTSSLIHEDTKAFGGKATLRVVTISGHPGHEFSLLVVIPNGRKAPAACFVGPNFSGNHTLVAAPKVAVTSAWMYPNRAKENKASAADRNKEKDSWNIEKSIDRGYAVATFYPGEIDADRADERTGLRPLLPKDVETTSIACWAWGIHRAVDYLVFDEDIDPKRIIAVGHSRLGKTALLAAAFDDRIAMAIPLQAGCGGTAPSRSKVGESVKQINDRFPHWFNGNFKRFNDDTSKLPFDQNCLVALCAPRPVLFANAEEDSWANPVGQFEVLKTADATYRFLGAGGLEAKEMPASGKLSAGTLGYFLRPGKHSMALVDWQAFWDFADKHLKAQ